MDESNMVQILVACAMQGIWFSSINCLWWGGTKETGSQMEVCAIYNIRFTRMYYLWLGNTKETVSQIKVCAIYGMRFTRMSCLRWDIRTEMVQLNKMCVIRGKHVYNQKCVRRLIVTQTIASNSSIWDWWIHHRRVPQCGPCSSDHHLLLVLARCSFYAKFPLIDGVLWTRHRFPPFPHRFCFGGI